MHRPLADTGEILIRTGLQGLTPRERQIVECVAAGLSNRQISDSLGINEQTVKNRLTAIFHKVGVTSRLQLAVRAHGHDEAASPVSS
jgi:DNA-binding NarL/FixJ family response regulator